MAKNAQTQIIFDQMVSKINSILSDTTKNKNTAINEARKAIYLQKEFRPIGSRLVSKNSKRGTSNLTLSREGCKFITYLTKKSVTGSISREDRNQIIKNFVCERREELVSNENTIYSKFNNMLRRTNENENLKKSIQNFLRVHFLKREGGTYLDSSKVCEFIRGYQIWAKLNNVPLRPSINTHTYNRLITLYNLSCPRRETIKENARRKQNEENRLKEKEMQKMKEMEKQKKKEELQKMINEYKQSIKKNENNTQTKLNERNRLLTAISELENKVSSTRRLLQTAEIQLRELNLTDNNLLLIGTGNVGPTATKTNTPQLKRTTTLNNVEISKIPGSIPLNRQYMNELFILVDTLHDFAEGKPPRGPDIKAYLDSISGGTSIDKFIDLLSKVYKTKVKINNQNVIYLINLNKERTNGTTKLSSVNENTFSYLQILQQKITGKGNNKYTSIIQQVHEKANFQFKIPQDSQIIKLKMWYFYYELYRSLSQLRTKIVPFNLIEKTLYNNIKNNKSLNNYNKLQRINKFLSPQRGMLYLTFLEYLQKTNKFYAIDAGQGMQSFFIDTSSTSDILLITPAQITDSANLVTPSNNGITKSPINLVIKVDSPKNTNNNNWKVYKQAELDYNGKYTLLVYVKKDSNNSNNNNNQILGDKLYKVSDKNELTTNYIYHIQNDFMSFYVHKYPIEEEEEEFIPKSKIFYSQKGRYFRKEDGGLSVAELSSIFSKWQKITSNKIEIGKMFKWCLDTKRCGDSFQHEMLADTVINTENGRKLNPLLINGKPVVRNGVNQNKYRYLSKMYILTFDYLSAAYGFYRHGRVLARIGGPTSHSYYLFDNV